MGQKIISIRLKLRKERGAGVKKPQTGARRFLETVHASFRGTGQTLRFQFQGRSNHDEKKSSKRKT